MASPPVVQAVHPLPHRHRSSQTAVEIPNAPYSAAFIAAMQKLPPSMAVHTADGVVDVEATARRVCAGAQWVQDERAHLAAMPTCGEGAIVGAIAGIGSTLIAALVLYAVYLK